jgi:hypothetical protein
MPEDGNWWSKLLNCHPVEVLPLLGAVILFLLAVLLMRYAGH